MAAKPRCHTYEDGDDNKKCTIWRKCCLLTVMASKAFLIVEDEFFFFKHSTSTWQQQKSSQWLIWNDHLPIWERIQSLFRTEEREWNFDIILLQQVSSCVHAKIRVFSRKHLDNHANLERPAYPLTTWHLVLALSFSQ